MKKIIFLILMGMSSVVFAADKHDVRKFFPEELQDIEIKQEPLTEQQKAFLRKQGASEFAINTYGPIYVDGYHSNHLRWGDLPLGEHGTVELKYDASAAAKFAPLPKQGHPRIFCIDSEREAHLKRLTETEAGKVALNVVLAATEFMKGRYDNDADYAKPDYWQGSFGGTHGMLPLFRYGNHGKNANEKNKQVWDAYAAGQTVEPALNIGLLALEAYRCWVFDDAENGRKVALALETILRAGLKEKKVVGGYNTAYIYDFAYKFMTADQRKLALSCLLQMNYQNNQYGCFQDAEGTTSNWATFSYRILQFLATEGEEGYNDLMYLGYNRGMENYLTYGWFNAGTCFEGMGKNQLAGENIYMLHRRGSQIAGHPHLLAHVKNYMPHAILPWGGEYIAYDRLGGVKNLNFHDYLPLKNLYPDDKVVDWVYRNAVHDDYSFVLGDTITTGGYDGYFNNAMFVAVFLRDYMKDNSDPAKLGLEESFIDPQRSLMITRSDWSKDAAYLQHHVRGRSSGGHVFSDRGSIVYAGRGMLWMVHGATNYKTTENSVVTVNDRELPNNAPARMAAYKRGEYATFSTGDMRDTYNWLTGFEAFGKFTRAQVEAGDVKPREGWEWNDFTRNRYALVESKGGDFITPEYLMPSWIDPGKVTTAIRKKSDFQMKTAFRTSGMVRGEYPYALVIDDYEAADGQEHDFVWRARLPDDVFVYKCVTTWPDAPKKGNQVIKEGRRMTDITLAPHSMYPAEKSFGHNASLIPALGTPMLLIKVLECGGELVEPGKGLNSSMLEIPARAKKPQFKILLYAYRHGQDRVPDVKWLKDEKLEISFGDIQKDIISFSSDEESRTRMAIDRVAAQRMSAVKDPKFDY